MNNKWTVIKTPCYPKAFKVVNLYYRSNNSWTEYFETQGLAQEEADKRNGVSDENINNLIISVSLC